MSMFQEHDRTVDWGRKGSQAVVTLACLFIVLTGMKVAAGVLVPVVYAFFLAVLSYPLVSWMRRHRVPAGLALGITMLMNLGVLAGLITVGVRLLVSFWADLPRYLRGLEKYSNDVGAWLETKGVEGAKETLGGVFDWNTLVGYATQQDVMSNLGGLVGSTFGTLATLFGSLVMVLILMLFILLEARGTRSRLQAVNLSGGPDFSGLMRSASDIQKYLGVKTLISALTGLLAGFWCWFFDLHYPLLWALLAFLFNFIPAVGSAAACIPAVIEALVQHGPGTAIFVAIGYGGINFCLDTFVQPTMLGNRFGISPLVVILSVIFWGWLWGPLGMFLAVPLTMVLKVLLDNSAEFKWISVAMAKKKVRRGEVAVAGYDLHLNEGETIGSGASTEIPGRE
ncbi:AI-2E family transporter [Prosthecobacter sp.]|uniref:AI-2E family transporter n=1 Tax=Prosthecobacter sp. TaxID=1965333 RepID=UPI002AB7FFCE|nr:AI-2E family transporter [Prosthecobacter sp.]MDZ4404252.1 AI-2E family transporter [Prosthecobacter sp.]